MSDKRVILDASAIIALINQEPGWEVIEPLIPHSIMSSVNVAEVAKFLIGYKGYNKKEAKEIIEHILDEVISFTAEHAYLSAELYNETKKLGLSLGDRSCLTLAIATSCPIYTADKAWKNLTIPKIKINLIKN